MKQQSVSGIILAGGKSSRMGRDKALIQWKGRRLVDYLTEAMEPVCDEILISTHLDSSFFRGYRVIRDLYSDMGPLAGIESGLREAQNPMVIFASVDTPLLNSELFAFLLNQHGGFDISLAAHEGVNEPMIGVYSKQVHARLESFIRQGNHKPPDFIRSTRWQEVNVHPGHNFYHPQLFKNLNRPQDLI